MATAIRPGAPGKHRNGSGSNPSPVTDGEHLVVYYKSGKLACLDLAGQVQWQTNLQESFGADTLWWDLGTSPVLADGLVVVAVMNTGDGFLVAFDLETGSEVWKQPRLYDVPKETTTLTRRRSFITAARSRSSSPRAPIISPATLPNPASSCGRAPG